MSENNLGDESEEWGVVEWSIFVIAICAILCTCRYLHS